MLVLSASVLAAISCSGGGGPSGGCTPSADTCAGETICVSGACVDAFPRVYEITDVIVQASTTDETGATWDALGGAPDPMIIVYANGSPIGSTVSVANVFSAIFPGPFNASLIAGSSLVIEVYDEDVTVNDLMFTCTADPIPATLLRQRDLSCSAGGFTVSFQIDPR